MITDATIAAADGQSRSASELREDRDRGLSRIQGGDHYKRSGVAWKTETTELENNTIVAVSKHNPKGVSWT